VRPDVETLIVGAGFSGLGAAIMLDRAGLGDYLIIEAADGVGGTWYWNTYPGIAVDIPSFSYQFSFEQSPDWSRTSAPGAELRAYAEHCADKYQVRSRIRFGTRVLGAGFDEPTGLWQVHLDSGETLTTRFLLNASGAVSTRSPVSPCTPPGGTTTRT
jgi:cyclohexanone monooxygenase